MQSKNQIIKVSMLITALILFSVWIAAPAFAQLSTSDAKKGEMGAAQGMPSGDAAKEKAMQEKNASNTGADPMGQMGMPHYLVMIHDSGNNCQEIMKEISSGMPMKKDDSKKIPGTMGKTSGDDASMHKMASWKWGCGTDNQTLYIFTNAQTEEAALMDIPANLRGEAKVIKMSSVSGNPDQMHQMGQKSKSMQGQTKY